MSLIEKEYALEKAENQYYLNVINEQTKNEIIKFIKSLPSAQPDNDCIWEALSKVYNMGGVPDEAKSIVGDVMLGLDKPSAEPEQRWISVSERLPEDEYVLISRKPTKLSGSKWCVTIAIRTADPRSGKIHWRDIGFGAIQDDKVLAWMPLPKPYEGGEAE